MTEKKGKRLHKNTLKTLKNLFFKMLEVEVREEGNYLRKREEEKSEPGFLELKRKYGE